MLPGIIGVVQATEAIKLLEQNRERPFFLGVGFYRPHSPHIAPKKFFDLYPIEKIHAASYPTNDLDDIPLAALFMKPPHWGATEEQQREVIEFVYHNLWSQGLPLVQLQDHVVIYRGEGIPGLI